MSSGNGGGFGLGVGVAGGPSLAAAQQGQGVAALLVMLAVLCFIFAYCCWGAPFCRSLCRRHCCCRLEDPELDPRYNNTDQAMVATPTIILLPHGRMLVVDGTIFTQFQADATGLDLVELGENVIRAQRTPRCVNRHQLQNSQGSILEMDAETPSKDSIGSIGCFPPPTYESIYGKDEGDMPPSYSDIVLHRFANLPYEIELHDYCHGHKDEIELHSLDSCPHIITNPINNMTYHPYATITSFSSQSFPRRNITRNSSLISNPLDDFYLDNEFNGIITRGIGQTNVTTMPTSQSQNLNETTFNEEPHRSHNRNGDITNLNQTSSNYRSDVMRPNDEALIERRRFSEDIEQYNNQVAMMERHSRDEQTDNRMDYRNIQFQTSVSHLGEITLSIEPSSGNISGANARQIIRGDSRREGHQTSNDEIVNNDEETNDFGALADIRESRV
ncbi:hypothetical protein PV327_003974 [Microctonus hyperodae]|uniref:Uncharacterized protein n=1 Tax=Microctonus hyperodae TaxID=165561 RepID=A0AA39G627_MICHY|nr:hypothetical protein PV327_003974 [Microctonus hyperodae]